MIHWDWVLTIWIILAPLTILKGVAQLLMAAAKTAVRD